MKAIFFPFRSLFTKLALQQRWWHRLLVVIFFLTLLLFASFLTFLVHHDVSSYTPTETLLTVYNGQVQSAVTTGIDLDFIPSQEPSVAMTSPDGKNYWIPQDQVSAATHAGGVVDKNTSPGPKMDIFDRVALQDQIEKDGFKVSVPAVGLVAFPKFMKEADVARVCGGLYSVVRSARRKLFWKEFGYSLTAFAVFFYATQGVYRLFLYVVFGTTVAPKESAPPATAS